MYNIDSFVAGLHYFGGVGPSTFKKFISHFGSIEGFYNAAINDLNQFNEKARDHIQKALNFDINILNEYLKKRNLEVVYYHSEKYPKRLREINDPPLLLYYRGNPDVFNLESISVVGTRRITDYGKLAINELAESMKDSGLSIVSGLASGVDGNMHQASLNVNIANLAILASNPEKCTPAGNSNIYKQILDQGGLVLSEFSINSKIHPGMFVVRNRVIAGLSKYTLVIEAPEKSGALVTARIANEYDREVFAVPGNINNPNSYGCNKLIDENIAKIYLGASEFLEYIGVDKIKKIESRRSDLTNEQLNIYDLLSTSSKNLDELSELTNIPINNIKDICLGLELESIIVKDNSGKYKIK